MKHSLTIVILFLFLVGCEDNKRRNDTYYQPRNFNNSPINNTLPTIIPNGNVLNRIREQPVRDIAIERTLDFLLDRPSNNLYQIPVRTRKATPNDAYSEGYEEGYAQGRIDGSSGESHGYGYDDSNSYYDYYHTKYCEGYEEGYDDGYYSGLSDYEEEQEELEEEEEW